MLLVLTNSCSMPPTKRKRAAAEAAKGAVKRRRRDASEASTTQTAPSVASYGDALIDRVTAEVTATVTTSIAGIIKETVEAAVRQAMKGQSGANSGDGVDGQAPLLVDQLGADDLPLGLSINTVEPGVSLDTPTGETGLNNLPDNSPIPNSFPIDARIPDNIKEKVWANQYVELGLLLHPHEVDKYSMAMSTASGSPSLCLLPRKPKQISTLDQWNSAFNIFMTIYLTKFPTQAVAMLKHSETVNQLAKKGGDFIRYDENVRYLRQSKVMAWDIFHTEQYVQAMTNVNKIVPVKNTSSPIPRGYCFEHHAGRFCPGCVHSHRCPACGGPHPMTKCLNAQNQSPTTHPFRLPQGRGFRNAFQPPQPFSPNYQVRQQGQRPRFSNFRPPYNQKY